MRKEFIDAVNSEDYDLIKIMMCNSLLVDPSGADFDEMFEYANNELKGLLEDYDGEELNNDTSQWDKKFLDKQLLKLEDNFSEERIKYVKLLSATVLNGKLLKLDENQRRENYQENVDKQKIGTVVAVAGVITSVAGIILNKPIIVGLGVTTIVIGGVMYYIERR